MRKRHFSRMARVLIVLGLLLQLWAMVALFGQGPLLEYAVCAPEVQKIASGGSEEGATTQTQVETGLQALMDTQEKVEDELAEAVTAVSCAGMRSGVNISAKGNSATATLVAAGRRYLETCPQEIASGRWMDGAELQQGTKIALLDEDLAFALFGSEPCEGMEVEIEGTSYRVIGTVHHRRSVGEVDAYCAYIPLKAADRQGLQLETMTMYALPAVSAGLDQSFQTLVSSSWGEGSFYSMRKERMGALMLTRVIAFAFGLVILARLMGLLRRFCGVCRAHIAQLRLTCYARGWLWPATWRILLIVLSVAVLLLAFYGLLSFLIEPVYSFTEWVPESLVELSALKKVFWDRVAQGAQLVRVNTPEAAYVSFWGGMARLGGVALLLGLAMGRKNEKKMRKEAKTGNQSTPQTV